MFFVHVLILFSPTCLQNDFVFLSCLVKYIVKHKVSQVQRWILCFLTSIIGKCTVLIMFSAMLL